VQKIDLPLKPFRRVPAQIINDDTRKKRPKRPTALLRRLNTRTAKQREEHLSKPARKRIEQPRLVNMVKG